MSKKFIVKTEKGSSNSLKQSVKIAFTITPTDLGDPTCRYDSITNWVTPFTADTEKTVPVDWAIPPLYGVFSCNLKGRSFQNIKGLLISPGQSATLESSAEIWGPCVPHADQATAILTNTSGSRKSLAIHVYGPHAYLVTIPSFESGSSVKLPSSWRLQAYVVGDQVANSCIAYAEDLKHPIFQVPIDCHTLPDSSIWTLCQDPDGTIRLKNDNYPELGYPLKETVNATAEEKSQPPERLKNDDYPGVAHTPKETTSGTAEEKNQLSSILERLTLIEKSIGNIQEDVRSGQQAMFDIRNQLSSVEKAAGVMREEMIATQESQAAAASTFERSQNHLAALQEAVTATQQQLFEMDKSTKGQLQELNHRVPVVESKTDKLASSLAHSDERLSGLEGGGKRTSDHVIAVERAVNRTQDHVHLVQQLVVATNSKVSTMDQHSRHTGLETDSSSRAQATMEQGVEPNEGQVNLEKSLSQVQEQLSAVKKVVRTIDRRVPSVEGRTDELESSVGQTRVDLAAAQASLVTLNRRVSAIEVRLAGEGERVDWSSSEGSPITFPVHLPPNTSCP